MSVYEEKETLKGSMSHRFFLCYMLIYFSFILLLILISIKHPLVNGTGVVINEMDI